MNGFPLGIFKLYTCEPSACNTTPLTFRLRQMCHKINKNKISHNAEQRKTGMTSAFSAWVYDFIGLFREVYESSGIRPHVLYTLRFTPGTRRALWATEELSSQSCCGRDGNQAVSRSGTAGRTSRGLEGLFTLCPTVRRGDRAGLRSLLPLGKWSTFLNPT